MHPYRLGLRGKVAGSASDGGKLAPLGNQHALRFSVDALYTHIYIYVYKYVYIYICATCLPFTIRVCATESIWKHERIDPQTSTSGPIF